MRRTVLGAAVVGVLVLLPGCGGGPEVTPPAAERSAEPSEYAAGVDGVRKFAVVEVTLSNGSSAPIEASNALLRATSGNGEAGTVFDGDRSTLPTSRVLPGKSLKWRQAFGQPGGDLVVTADWNFQGPVTFQ